jgi:hypothetical protein
MKVLRPEQFPLPVTGSYSRASTATYIDEGVLKTAAVNEPRWQDGYLLLEKAATNLLLQSEQFNNTPWSKFATTVATDAVISPTNTANADTLVENTSNNEHYVQSANITVTSGAAYTISLYVKALGTNRTIRLSVFQASSPFTSFASMIFNPMTGVIDGTTIGTAFVTELENDWWRIQITNVIPVTSVFVRIALRNGTNFTYTGDGVSGVHLFGAQLETGNKATSYIQTTTAAVTRAADTITGTGLVWTNATNANADWSSATTYSVGQKVTYSNKTYESLQGSNLNKQPDTNPLWWLDLGADNKTAFLDTKVNTQSTRTENLRCILSTGKINTFALLELNADLIKVQVNDNSSLGNFEVTYSASGGLSGAEVSNWYDYFFVDPLSEPITQIVFDGVPDTYSSNIVSFNLDTDPAKQAAVGYFVAGLTTQLGYTQYGVRAGIVDYSRKDTDEFGNTVFVERPYSKRLTADVYVDNYDVNKVQRFLYSIRATPVLWMASDDPQLSEASYVYGFYKDFSTTIAYPTMSMCSLEIEGLT